MPGVMLGVRVDAVIDAHVPGVWACSHDWATA